MGQLTISLSHTSSGSLWQNCKEYGIQTVASLMLNIFWPLSPHLYRKALTVFAISLLTDQGVSLLTDQGVSLLTDQGVSHRKH